MSGILAGILLSIDVLILVAFGLGYLGWYVHPRYAWWLQIFALFLPYLGMAVVLATAVTLVTGSLKLAALNVAACLLVLARFAPFERPGRTAAPANETLKVFTLNVRGKYESDAEHEADPMFALVQGLRPDLLALQEAYLIFPGTTPEWYPFSTLAGLLQSEYTAVKPEPPREYGIMQPTLARAAAERGLRVERQEQLDPLLPGEGVRVTRVTFAWGEQRAVLYNVHLLSYRLKPWDVQGFRWSSPAAWRNVLRMYRNDFVVRAREAEAVRQILDRETLPFIVCGDLNSTPHNWVYRHVSRHLSDAFKISGRSWGATYHAQLPLFRIDYILTSPDWEIRSADVSDVDFSDHRAVSAEVRLRRRP